ncbi:MAG: amino acid transporter [Candidatus Brocadia sp. WS118]|nr:MAG: amino acid transporter [Candidatus Brocadia sp. WS118]
MKYKMSVVGWLKNVVIGRARSPQDRTIFHKLSLVAFFAWIGLGADGLSSSCYGPEEAFRALQGHYSLSLFVAIGTVLTIFVISASYSQIIELFPSGGGGYHVASKLLSPTCGMISGCALIVDYVLTITVSIASGADAIFSFLPAECQPYKLSFAVTGIVFLTLLNLRGVKEAVLPLMPIFLIFVITHAFVIVYGPVTHMAHFQDVIKTSVSDVHGVSSKIGIAGMLLLILRSYCMGAGTYTGIEAVSNGLPILREPRVQTAKTTMRYMAASLSVIVMGLMLAFLIYRVEPQTGKTLNAVLFERVTAGWRENSGSWFVIVALASEALLLFIGAQTGFLDGPRVIANMAMDRWFPTRFSVLSDRLVAKNGILFMGIAAMIVMFLTRGAIHILVVLYSINVFITFVLSQLGMVRYWWITRSGVKHRWWKLLINGVGLVLTVFILVSVVILKFHHGGWITLVVTGALAVISIVIKEHYNKTVRLLSKLDNLVQVADASHPVTSSEATQRTQTEFDPTAKTAVLLVSGFNGRELHTLFNVIRTFEKTFRNFIFVEVGVVDAGNFKGIAEIENLRTQVKNDVDRYVNFMQRHGYFAEGLYSIGVDVVDEIVQITLKILERFHNPVFFGGQLIFPKDSFLSRLLHNYTIFAVQRRLYNKGFPVVIMPIRI